MSQSATASIPVKIITLFRQYPDTVLSKKLIFKKCWDKPYTGSDANSFYVNMHLARNLLDSGRIVLVKRQGYRWVP